MSRDVFVTEHEDIRIEGESNAHDSKILITLSSVLGERTALITPTEVIESKSKLFVQAPRERVTVGAKKVERKVTTYTRNIGYVLTAILVLFSISSAMGLMKARIVLTGSMVPTINPGDVVLLAPPATINPKVGAIVSYTARRFDGTPVGTFTHRIMSGDPIGGYVVKGDANPTPDIQHPKIADISGVVFFKIPFIGKLLTPKSLLIIVPCIVGFWFVMDALKNED